MVRGLYKMVLPVQPSVLKPKYPERHRSHLRPPTPGLHGHCPPFLLQVKISLPDERVPGKSKKKYIVYHKGYYT